MRSAGVGGNPRGADASFGRLRLEEQTFVRRSGADGCLTFQEMWSRQYGKYTHVMSAKLCTSASPPSTYSPYMRFGCTGSR